MTYSKLLTLTVAGLVLGVLPQIASAQTITDHAAPSLPKGAVVGVTATIIASSSPNSGTIQPSGVEPTTSSAATTTTASGTPHSFWYLLVGLGVLVLVGIGFLSLSSRKKGI